DTERLLSPTFEKCTQTTSTHAQLRLGSGKPAQLAPRACAEPPRGERASLWPSPRPFSSYRAPLPPSLSPQARPSFGGGAASSGHPVAWGCFVFLVEAGSLRVPTAALRRASDHCTGGAGPAYWAAPRWTLPGHFLRTCVRQAAGDGDSVWTPPGCRTAPFPGTLRISAKSPCSSYFRAGETDQAGSHGEGGGQARASSQILQIPVHVLRLEFPESGGQNLGTSVPVIQQRKMDSGRGHRDETKVRHTGMLFFTGKNKTSEFSKLNLP
ncbi:uncharacterized protein LOC111734963, partial [Pteropus vampyrus]|uniref:Uncharacterized protein LOC111734963 n=1 Tax=Pteropus vampyrus TaxID=132908 RepID=A0A6P6C5G9_PTEVA